MTGEGVRGFEALVDTFPCLEVVSPVSDGAAVRRGDRLVLVDGFSIGRHPDSGLQVLAGTLAPRHAHFEFKHQRWWVFDRGSTNGTRKNGVRVRDAEVQQGDVVELPNGLAFRVWLTAPPDENVELERRLLEDLDDDERWLVWGDWLLEHGNPVGQRVLGEPTDAEDDARALGSLGSAWRDGWLDVDFHHGFPRRVVVRGPAPVLPLVETPTRLVARVVTEPACRFLRHLEVDPASFGTGLQATEETLRVVSLLATTSALAPLETVRVGPVGLAALPESVQATWSDVQARYPRLTTPLERVLFSASQATLEVVRAPSGVSLRPAPGRSIGLSNLHPNFIGQLDECAVFVTCEAEHEAARLALRVEAEGHRWFIEDIAGLTHGRNALAPALRVNGREQLHAHLRDGDVLEPMEGFTVRFRLR